MRAVGCGLRAAGCGLWAAGWLGAAGEDWVGNLGMRGMLWQPSRQRLMQMAGSWPLRASADHLSRPSTGC